MRIPVVLDARVVVAFLAVACWARGASYWLRAPHPSGYADLIEGVVSYRAWAVILLAAGALIVGGLRWVWAGWFGHLAALWCYLTFALSVLAAALLDGQAWTGVMALLALVWLHGVRLFQIGSQIGRGNGE